MATATDKICLELRHIEIELQQQRVLKDVSFVLKEQEIVSLIGPNGAGKTTLFNIICGQRHPSRGSVIFQGCDITRWPPHRICHAGIARTFQIARPFSEMTAAENVSIGLWFGNSGTAKAVPGETQAMDLLELAGLAHKAHTAAKDLTLSELRRLEVARALATGPRLLLLDEICAGLSPQAINHAVDLVRALRDRGVTLLIVDHFLTLTAKISDRLIALDQGEKIVEGKPAEVLEYPEVISAYLGERPQKDQE